MPPVGQHLLNLSFDGPSITVAPFLPLEVMPQVIVVVGVVLVTSAERVEASPRVGACLADGQCVQYKVGLGIPIIAFHLDSRQLQLL